MTTTPRAVAPVHGHSWTHNVKPLQTIDRDAGACTRDRSPTIAAARQVEPKGRRRARSVHPPRSEVRAMIDFHYGSGSPYAWRVWLALEHKQLPYKFHLLSFQGGDLKKPEFLALNPRHQVPVIVDDGFALYESGAICEYLEEKYPERPIFPKAAKERAIVRRLVLEAEHHLYPITRALGSQLFFTPKEKWDEAQIAEGKQKLLDELAVIDASIAGDWIAGAGPSVADFAYLPFLALIPRYEIKKPDVGISAAIPKKVGAWLDRMRALPYFDKTIPPHWKTS
jgi:glutathione S-transferase